MSLMEQQWCPASVQVTVLQARGLRIKGKSGTNDAYALMQVGREKYQTSVAEKCVAPVWKEEAAFDLPPPSQAALHVQVMHRALVGPDKLLGQAVISPLQPSGDDSRSRTEWFKLLDKTGKADKDRGEVLLDIQFMRSNMTASMFDLSAAGKSRSRLSKLKDKVRGKKKESDTMSSVVPSFTQVLTDSEEERGEVSTEKDEKKKKLKMKSLFSPKSNLQRNLSQSMSVLPASSSLSGSQSPGLNVEASEGKKKFKFMIHKRSGSSDSKDPSSGLHKHSTVEQSNLCINGSHVYCEEPQTRTSRIGSNFSLTSSGHGSMEDVPERQYSPCTEEDEEMANVDNIEENVDEEERMRMEEESMKKGEVEERLRRQEEEIEKLSEENRGQEEEKNKREEERKRKEKDEMVRKEEECKKLEEKRKLEEQERRRTEEAKKQREEEEQIKMEKRRRQDEERFRREEEEQRRLEEEERRVIEEKVREEERKRREEERAEEERRRREEEERVREEERAKKEKEEYQRLVEERLKLEEEKKRTEAEQKIKKEEEQKVRLEEERRRKEEEAERIRRENEKQEEERRLEEEERRRIEEEEKRQREKQERIREEEVRRREEEERAKKEREYERLVEERRRQEEHERIQKEEEERIRKETEERIMMEEKERVRKESEEMKRLAEKKMRKEEQEKKQKEERIQKEEEERIRIEEQRRRQEEEESVRKEREEMKRLAEEKMRLEEQENMKIEKEEKSGKETKPERKRKENEIRKLEKEELAREAEGQKTENKSKDGLKSKVSMRGPTEVTSSNPSDDSHSTFEENAKSTVGPERSMAKVSSIHQGCQSAVASVEIKSIYNDEKDLISVQSEKRPAPQPPGSNQAERLCQRDTDVATRHLAQANKQSKDKDIKTASVLPQRSVHLIAPVSRSPIDTKSIQSSMQNSSTKGATSAAVHSKRPAPPRPTSVDEGPSSKPKTTSTSVGDISAGGLEHIVYGFNPFEDDEEENEEQEYVTTSRETRSICWPPAMSRTGSQTKMKSSKVARAPAPPADVTTVSTSGTLACDQESEVKTSVQAQKSPVQETQTVAQNTEEEAGVKKQVAPTASRRLQPVKPLNPLEQQSVSVIQGENDNKSTGILSDFQDKMKSEVNNAGLKGPYSQLTRDELISLVLKQEKQLSEKNSKISELEQYIDNLLVRVMEEKPSILMSLSSVKKAA